MSKRPPFVRVAGGDEIPEGAVKHVIVHDKPIALCRAEGNFYAINAVCPHMGGPLAEGRLISETVVECPWHKWTFDVRTGKPDHEGGHEVAAYEVKVEGDDILIGWLKKT